VSNTASGLGRPAALGGSDGRPGAEERALAELFTQLGRELTAPRSLDGVLAVITRRAVEVIPAAEHAAVSRSGKNGFETVASTSDVPARVDGIQYRLGTGPCVDAALDDATYRVGELAESNRWREFGREAAEKEGIHSMLSVRLFLEDDDLIAGLNLYSGQVDAFDDSDETTATLLATHGALAVAAARNRDKAENLQRALITSRQIGIAMGILMATDKVTEDQAFGLLRIASQSRHRKLADLAVEVAETGMLELPPLPRRRPAHDGPQPHPR
jgi:GAF domain-containing protein